MATLPAAVPRALCAPRWAWAGPAALAASLYLPTLFHGFPWDDELIVRDQKWLRDPASVGQLLDQRYFRSGEISWRPLPTLTHLVEMQLVGAPPPPAPGWRDAQGQRPVPWAAHLREPPAGPFHLTNVLLHGAVAALCALLAWRALGWIGSLDPIARAVGAAVAGTCMAVHPACVEAVAVISFREDLLAAVGMLGALWCLAPGAPVGLGWRAGGWGLAGVAIFSKESALLLPALLVAAEWLGTVRGARRGRTRVLAAHAPVWVLAATYAALRFGPMRGPLEPVYAAFGATPPYRWLLVPAVWIEHVRLLCFPLWLRADYFLPAPVSPWDLRVVLGCGLAAAGLVALVAAWRTGWRVAALGGLLVLATWLPVSNLVPLPNPFAERYCYVAVAGLGLILAEAAERSVRGRPAARERLLGVAVLLAVLAAARTLPRELAWRDSDAVWKAEPEGSMRGFAHVQGEAERTGDSVRLLRVQREALARFGDLPFGAAPTRWHWIRGLGYAWRVHGLTLRARAEASGTPGGERAELEAQVREAFAQSEQVLREALALHPLHYLTYEDLGTLAREQGRFQEALDWYRQSAARAAPQAARALLNAGDMSYELGRFEEAEATWRRALELDPGGAYLCNAIAKAIVRRTSLSPADLVRTQAGRDAMGLWAIAAASNPWDAHSRLNLGMGHLMLGQFLDARRVLGEAFDLAPADPQIASATADAAERVGDWPLARAALERWVALEPDNPAPRERLARRR